MAPNGTFTLTGTAGDDNISLTPSGISISTSGGSTSTFIFSEYYPVQLKEVIIRALAGSDSVSQFEINQVSIDLGTGDDRALITDSIGNIIGAAGNDIISLSGGGILDVFDGGPGVDSIDLTLSRPDTGDLDIDLRQFPKVENVINAHSDVVGNALSNYITLVGPNFPFAGEYHFVGGGGGNDTVVGDIGVPTWFDSGDGDDAFIASDLPGDTFLGGNGADTVDYSRLNLDLTVDLSQGIGGAPGFQDALIGVQNAIGGSGNDVLIGDNNRNILSGGAGNDTITGNGGHDVLIGGSGNDVFFAQDKKRDNIFGDDGFDAAFADRQDRLFGVEAVVR
jgi:Ca2+-binding RTX toxin-like protein